MKFRLTSFFFAVIASSCSSLTKPSSVLVEARRLGDFNILPQAAEIDGEGSTGSRGNDDDVLEGGNFPGNQTPNIWDSPKDYEMPSDPNAPGQMRSDPNATDQMASDPNTEDPTEPNQTGTVAPQFILNRDNRIGSAPRMGGSSCCFGHSSQAQHPTSWSIS